MDNMERRMLHSFEMKLRRDNQNARRSQFTYPPHVPHSSQRKPDKVRTGAFGILKPRVRGERNSIWPEDKTAKPGRLG